MDRNDTESNKSQTKPDHNGLVHGSPYCGMLDEIQTFVE